MRIKKFSEYLQQFAQNLDRKTKIAHNTGKNVVIKLWS